MWTMIVISVALAWVYPFTITFKNTEITLTFQHYVALTIFWGVYACIDLILYFPEIIKKIKTKIQNRRNSHSFNYCLSIAQKLIFYPEAVHPHQLEKIQDKETMLTLISILIMTKKIDFLPIIEKWLTLITNSPKRWIAYSYLQIQEPDLAFYSIKDLMFNDIMPSWMKNLDIKPRLEELTSIPLPIYAHHSWDMWRKRLTIAHILTSNSHIEISNCLLNMPEDWKENIFIQLSILETIFKKDLGHSEKYVFLNQDLLEIYKLAYNEITDEFLAILNNISNIGIFENISINISELIELINSKKETTIQTALKENLSIVVNKSIDKKL